MKLNYLTIFLSMLGLIYLCVFIHEGIHVMQAGMNKDVEATAVCLSLNLKIHDDVQDGYLIAFTQFDNYDNIEVFTTWRELIEKQVRLIMQTLIPILAFFLGFMFKIGLKYEKVK